MHRLVPQRESKPSLYGTIFATGAAPQYCISDSPRLGQASAAGRPQTVPDIQDK